MRNSLSPFRFILFASQPLSWLEALNSAFRHGNQRLAVHSCCNIQPLPSGQLPPVRMAGRTWLTASERHRHHRNAEAQRLYYSTPPRNFKIEKYNPTKKWVSYILFYRSIFLSFFLRYQLRISTIVFIVFLIEQYFDEPMWCSEF